MTYSINLEDYSFLLIKPHAYKHKDEIIKDIETVFEILLSKSYEINREIAEEHYSAHKKKHFFDGIVYSLCDGESLAMIVYCKEALQRCFDLVGDTNVLKAKENNPNSLRAKYGEIVHGDPLTYNAVHRADSIESFCREVKIHFTEEELEVLPKEVRDYIYKN